MTPSPASATRGAAATVFATIAKLTTQKIAGAHG
jgi:hypothetical protein